MLFNRKWFLAFIATASSLLAACGGGGSSSSGSGTASSVSAASSVSTSSLAASSAASASSVAVSSVASSSALSSVASSAGASSSLASSSAASSVVGLACTFAATDWRYNGWCWSNPTEVGGPVATYDLTGFAKLPGDSVTGLAANGTTGGGVIAETDPAYRKVTTALELAEAIKSANKIAGSVKVIEIMNDLNLGWNEIGASAQTLVSTPFTKHPNTPKLHPVLLVSDVSTMQISAKGGGLTIFSANGATIRHSSWSIKATSNIIIRNLKFDELWEWDEETKGDYDKNNWDFIVIGVGGGRVHHVWIDHCTFTNAYDGIIDTKGGTSNVTYSWNAYMGDDGVANAFTPANANSFVRQQINVLEANKASYSLYSFLRDKMLLTPDEIVQVFQGTKKTMAVGELSKDVVNMMASVTFHHNLYVNPWDRLPRSAGAQIHNYNLYADDVNLLAARRMRDAKFNAMSPTDQASFNSRGFKFGPAINGSISVEDGAMLVEKSVYIDNLYPLRNNQTNPADASFTGKILGLDIIYTFHNTDGTTINVRGNSTDPGSPLGPFQDMRIKPFSWNTTHGGAPYTLHPSAYHDPASLLGVLQTGVGAGKLGWSKDNWLKTAY